jgi:hypothetical protein
LPSTIWVGLIQSVEDLNKTKGLNKGEFAFATRLSSNWHFNSIGTYIVASPASKAFKHG